MGVETSGGLVQEQNLRLDDELHPNVGSLSLSP